jgi:hypothetical protein
MSESYGEVLLSLKHQLQGEDGSLPNPIYYLLSEFLIKLARRDATVRDVADYLKSVDAFKEARVIRVMPAWDISNSVRSALTANGYSPDKWSEWHEIC